MHRTKRIKSYQKTKYHKIIIIAAVMIVSAFFTAVLSPQMKNIFSDTYAASSSTSDTEIQKLEERLSKAASDKKAAEKALSAAKSDQNSAVELKNAIDNEQKALMSIIEISESMIEQYNIKISETEDAIIATENHLEQRQEDFAKRLVTYYEEGQASYLEILLDAGGLTEFFSRLDFIRCIIEYDREVMKNLQKDKKTLELKKTDLISLREKAETLHDEKQLKSDELNAKIKEAEAMIQELEKDKDAAAKAYTEALAAEAELNQQIKNKIASLKEKTNSTYVGGEYQWPVPSKYSTVSSGFGNRIHPVTGKKQFHTSIDIPAPYGTEIYAANSGTVTEVAYHSADGNYILIDHGGGSATFYSHLSRFAVISGQKVNKGDIIGYVGMTGWATGYHLNFSIYENSTPVNPMKYFK